MGADVLLSRLEGIKRTGNGHWIAKCPAHHDRTPSLSIREMDDGRVLVHDFGGCDTGVVLEAVGLTFSDLFPDRDLGHHVKPERRPFPAADVLAAIAFESLVVLAAASSLLAGQPFTSVEKERLALAVARLQTALAAAGVHHG